MTNQEFKSLCEIYSRMSDRELAIVFVRMDKKIRLLWNDTPDEISDRHQIVSNLIIERYVEKCSIGLVWDDELQNWTNPEHKGKVRLFPDIRNGLKHGEA